MYLWHKAEDFGTAAIATASSNDAHQHTHSENSDHATSDLSNVTAIRRRHCRARDAEADPNPDEVEQTGRDYEARRRRRAGCIDRHFGFVRVAVKNRKQSDEAHSDRHRRFDIEGNDGA